MVASSLQSSRHPTDSSQQHPAETDADQLSPNLEHLATSFDSGIRVGIHRRDDVDTSVRPHESARLSTSLELSSGRATSSNVSGSARRRENDTNVWTLTDPPRAVFP